MPFDPLVLLIDRQPESVVSNALHAIGYLGRVQTIRRNCCESTARECLIAG